MPEKNSNKKVKDDEIDILDLFRRLGATISRWIRAIARAFMISIVFFLKSWLALGLSIVAGLAVSLLVKIVTPSSFSSDMTIRSNVAPTSDVMTYINRLHRFCIEDNSAALSDALSLNPDSIKNIIDIGAFWIIDLGRDGIPDYVDYRGKHDVYDTLSSRMQDRLDIRVKIKSPQALTILKNNLMTFLEKDSLFQQRNRVRLRQNLEMVGRLDFEIGQLDSLEKAKINEETRKKQPVTSGQMIFLQEQKTQLVYSDIFGLYARKQAIEFDRDLYKEIVTVLSDFSMPARRENGGFYYASIIVPIFFCLTLLIRILMANRRKIKEVYNKY